MVYIATTTAFSLHFSGELEKGQKLQLTPRTDESVQLFAY